MWGAPQGYAPSTQYVARSAGQVGGGMAQQQVTYSPQQVGVTGAAQYAGQGYGGQLTTAAPKIMQGQATSISAPTSAMTTGLDAMTAKPYGSGASAQAPYGGTTASQRQQSQQYGSAVQAAQYGVSSGPQPVRATTAPATSREQVLEQRVRELEFTISQKDQTIKELQERLYNKGGVGSGSKSGPGASKSQVRSPGRTGSGFRKVSESKPVVRYQAADPEHDAIDVRLEEFYNSTGSAIQFRRINRGFYRFGDTIVELDIINHKLMARTEDGWNRGKFGPIDKFMDHYENIEREKAGIQLDKAE